MQLSVSCFLLIFMGLTYALKNVFLSARNSSRTLSNYAKYFSQTNVCEGMLL